MFALETVTPTPGKMEARKELRLHRADEKRIKAAADATGLQEADFIRQAALTIAKFDKALHDRSAFSCGFAPIDNFLKSSLSDQVKDGMVTAWIATAGGDSTVLGFYTLGAMAVRAEFGPKKWQRARVPDVPVIYIRAVAVREDMQGKRLGTALVIDAMTRCIGIADQMGAAAIVLDVLDGDHIDRRWKFYGDLGFLPLGDPENPRRVYIPMANVRATLK